MTNDEELPIHWDAWAVHSNSHGSSLGTPIWLPAGDEPETQKDWVRISSLDFTQLRPFHRRTNVR